MPEDVSPRDHRDQDHAERDRLKISCKLRGVHACPPLRQAVIDKPDCLPCQLEKKYWKHLQGIAKSETAQDPHSSEHAWDYPARRRVMAYQLRQKDDGASDHQYQVHGAQDVEPNERDFALGGGPKGGYNGGSMQAHFESPVLSRGTERRSSAPGSSRNSRRSPGWQASSWQIASSVEKRIARALPVFRMDRLARVMSIRSASSVRVMRRSCSRSSSLTRMAIRPSHQDPRAC